MPRPHPVVLLVDGDSTLVDAVINGLSPADVTIESIGRLLDYDLARLGPRRALASNLKVRP
jgi:hypothetical protein